MQNVIFFLQVRRKEIMMNVIRYFAILCVTTVSYAAQDAATSSGVRDLYQNYLDGIHQISFSAQNRDRVDEKGDVFTNVVSEKWKIDFVKKRVWRVASKMNGDPQKTDQLTPAPVYSETMLGTGIYNTIGVDRNTNTAKSFTSFVEPSKNFWTKEIGWGYLAPMFGYIQNGNRYLYIPDLLLEQTEVKRADGVTELLCETEEYRLSIRLATSSKAGMPEQIAYTRKMSEGSGTIKSMLYTVERATVQAGIWLPLKFHCKVENYSRQQKLPKNVRMVEGKVVVMPQSNIKGNDSIDIPAVTFVAEINLSDIHLNALSDNDFQFQAKVPNGLEVHMQDARHLKYAWLDGKIVPRVEALKSTDGFYFKNGSGTRWLLIVNVIAILLIIAYLIVRRKKA